MRRVLRILPVYYAVWFGVFLLSVVSRFQWDARWLIWPLHFGNYGRYVFSGDHGALDFIQVTGPHLKSVFPVLNLGPFWSLCVEEQFYLVWPAVVFLVRDQKVLLRICLYSLPLVLIARIALYFSLPHWMVQSDFLYRNTLTRVDAFLLGGALALTLRGSESRLLKSHGTSFCWIACVSAATGLAIYQWFPAASEFAYSTWLLTVVDLASAALIWQCVQPKSLLCRLFQWSPARRLGKISYGFYLFHEFPHSFYFSLSGLFLGRPTGLKTLPNSFKGKLLLASLSYTFLERPFLRLKRYFAHQVHRAPVVPAE